MTPPTRHTAIQHDTNKIAERLNVKKSTLEIIMQRAKASDSEDFNNVLTCLNDKQDGGNPERFPEGCEESIALGDISQQVEEHW
ncbi:hypothetical protein HOY82DRAFT_603911 [Tuber indicum]|nr:hypothetical protein HOY82DRAFT_603911 [Tuber indicum]